MKSKKTWRESIKHKIHAPLYGALQTQFKLPNINGITKTKLVFGRNLYDRNDK